ncbi:dynamin family protein [Vreelandella neptunia]|uniref:dynamin family protein n=1 Tax=Vreelandella neptunia TaxID=115551 RepID=UPI00315A0FAD
MDIKNTDLLRKEGSRLLRLQIILLRKMIDEDGLLKDASEKQKQSMDMERAHNTIAVMKGELAKLEKLDMVLAVIGTMKSGKSTTNNAIVGLEVLPNRNRPMTALPTLIRHTPGQKEPVLRFKKKEAINKFIKQLSIRLETPEGQYLLSVADQKEDLKKVADAICSDMKIMGEYRMEQGIFEFLKSLNDLVRLATALESEFPFEEFRSSDELPVIEVEFQHLRDSKVEHGRLSLLDTPGPNEEGQFALKPMMKEQLQRASGVVAVLDYTQLKSESDAEVRRELLDIAEVAQGRLSVLVNKFDQKDRHSDGAAEVKSLVANELLKGKISEHDVYPVSSRYAYLANRARTELALHGKLPDPQEHLWVEDFAEEGLGRRWEKDIGDVEKVNDAIKCLWEDSLFEIPLERVIQRAHAQAATLAIDSAASKLVASGERINNFLGLRETALKKSAEELKSYINSLQTQQLQVDQLEKKSQEELDILSEGVKNNFHIMTRDASENLKVSLEKYFENGRLEASKEAEDKSNKRKQEEDKNTNVAVRSLRKRKLPPQNNIQQKKHFDPKSSKVEFSDKRSAKKLLNNIEMAIEAQYKAVNNAMLISMAGMHDELHKQSNELEIQATSILKNLSARMNEGGFKLKLDLPQKKAIKIDVDSQQILNNIVAEKTRTVTRRRRQSGVWGSVCSLFGTDDWGWESYKETEEFFQIDIDKIREKVLIASADIFKNTENIIQKDVILPVEKSCAEFFIALKDSIEEIRGDLLQGLSDSSRSKQEQEELAQRLAVLKQENSDSENDLRSLKHESGTAVTTPLLEEERVLTEVAR